MRYVTKILQCNSKARIVYSDRMYDKGQCSIVIPHFSNDIPDAVQIIWDWSKGVKLSDEQIESVTFWLNHIIEIDRRMNVCVELHDRVSRELMFRKFF